jgi:hypothetical protein
MVFFYLDSRHYTVVLDIVNVYILYYCNIYIIIIIYVILLCIYIII